MVDVCDGCLEAKRPGLSVASVFSNVYMHVLGSFQIPNNKFSSDPWPGFELCIKRLQGKTAS